MRASNDTSPAPRTPVVVIVGLVAIVVAFVGFGAIHALQQPPFFPPDETAHLGYAHEVASFRLPEIRRFAEIPSEARRWAAERSMANDVEHRGVWVANHPPLHYIATAPLIWLSRITGAADGGLILMRFANVAFAAVGVVFTFLLASELTRRNHRVALLAAALVALVPQGHAVFSQGLNDGLGFAAGTAVVWAGARCLRRIDALTRGDLALLAATAIVAFGARAATMLLAVAVVGVVGLRRFTRPSPSPRDRLLAAAWIALVGLGPAVLAFGWFYVRNIALYGDIGASQYLLEMFRRQQRGSVFDMIVNWRMWRNVYAGLMSPSTLQRLGPPRSIVLTAIAAAGVGIVFVTGALSRRPADRLDRATLRWQLALCFAAVGLIAVTIAQHASGGGNPYARYAMPAIGVAAALVVIGLDRIWERWAPLLLVTVAGWWAVLNIPVDVDPTRLARRRDDGQLPPLALRVLPLGDGWRFAAGVLVFVGVVVAAGALVATIRPPLRVASGAELLEESPDPLSRV